MAEYATAICIGVTAISPCPIQMFAESPSRQSGLCTCFNVGKIPFVSCRVGKSGTFAKMKFPGHANDVLNARAQADGDEIGIAGLNDGAPEIVLARRRQIVDLPPADINVTRIVHNPSGSKPASSAAKPTMGLKIEPGA